MNAERLLQHYEQVADAPDAIARLRRFILDLAVRGKLVPQDPAEEPASELLRRIAAGKDSLLDAGKLKAEKPVKQAFKAEELYGLPAPWRWADLQAVCLSITDGDHLPPPKADKGVPFLVIGDVRDKTINYDCGRFVGRAYYEKLDVIRRPIKGDILYTLVGSFGIPVPVREDREFCVQRHIGILRPSKKLSVAFLTYTLESNIVFNQADKFATGIAQRTVPLAGLRAFQIPLPPLAEQHRIVAKVDELMALCDQLESARTERETKRDRLAAASLARLNTPEPETFRDDARFALDALPALTARPDQIKQLRQTILNLAVRGKLVPQDPADEPAILPPPKKFAAASGLNAAVFREFEGKLALPIGWHIAPLAQLAESIVDCPHTTPNWTDTGVICVRTSQLRSRKLDLSAPRFVTAEEYLERIERLEPKADDILYSREGGILGVACRVPLGIRLCLGQRLMLIRAGEETRADFLEIVLNSPFITDIARAQTTGGAAPRVNMSAVRAYPIPLPPLAEQHRIVAKVDELMALCDQLQTSMTNADEKRKKLLDALLAEALAPVNAEALQEAAE